LGIFEASGAIRVDIRRTAETEGTPRIIKDFVRGVLDFQESR
jgi:hypothetical protein